MSLTKNIFHIMKIQWLFLYLSMILFLTVKLIALKIFRNKIKFDTIIDNCVCLK